MHHVMVTMARASVAAVRGLRVVSGGWAAAPLPVLGPGGPALRVGLPPVKFLVLWSRAGGWGRGRARDLRVSCASRDCAGAISGLVLVGRELHDGRQRAHRWGGGGPAGGWAGGWMGRRVDGPVGGSAAAAGAGSTSAWVTGAVGPGQPWHRQPRRRPRRSARRVAGRVPVWPRGAGDRSELRHGQDCFPRHVRSTLFGPRRLRCRAEGPASAGGFRRKAGGSRSDAG
jgi:hypothetical protein